jgi:hypothetical protein
MKCFSRQLADLNGNTCLKFSFNDIAAKPCKPTAMLQQPFILCILHADGARHTMLFGGKEFKYFITCLVSLVTIYCHEPGTH